MKIAFWLNVEKRKQMYLDVLTKQGTLQKGKITDTATGSLEILGATPVDLRLSATLPANLLTNLLVIQARL